MTDFSAKYVKLKDTNGILLDCVWNLYEEMSRCQFLALTQCTKRFSWASSPQIPVRCSLMSTAISPIPSKCLPKGNLPALKKFFPRPSHYWRISHWEITSTN